MGNHKRGMCVNLRLCCLKESNPPPWSGPAAHPMEDAARFAEPTKILMINLTRRTYSSGVAKALGRSGRTLPRLINLGKISSWPPPSACDTSCWGRKVAPLPPRIGIAEELCMCGKTYVSLDRNNHPEICRRFDAITNGGEFILMRQGMRHDNRL